MFLQALFFVHLFLPLIFALLLYFCNFNIKWSRICSIAPAMFSVVVSSILIYMYVYQGVRLSISFGSFISFTAGVVDFYSFSLSLFSLFFSFLISILWCIAVFYAIGYMETAYKNTNLNSFFSFYTFALFFTNLVAFSSDLLTLFVCYELLSVSTIPLIVYASVYSKIIVNLRTYFFHLVGASIFLFLPALVFLMIMNGDVFFHQYEVINFTNNLDSFLRVTEDQGHYKFILLIILTLMFLFGIAKTAVIPLHYWLPNAMIAPVPVSALLHSVAVVNVGIFSLTRVIYHLLGSKYVKEAFEYFHYYDYLLYFICFGTLLSSIIALKQDNIKSRLAYSTISQLSYMLLAIFLLNPYSLKAVMFYMVAHAFGKICLFFAAGSIYISLGKSSIKSFQGVFYVMPWTVFCFIIGSASMVGLPLTAGFVAKWYLFEAIFYNDNFIVPALTILISTVMNIFYFFSVVTIFITKNPSYKRRGSNQNFDPSKWMLIPNVITAVITILLFLLAPIFIDTVTYMVRNW